MDKCKVVGCHYELNRVKDKVKLHYRYSWVSGRWDRFPFVKYIHNNKLSGRFKVVRPSAIEKWVTLEFWEPISVGDDVSLYPSSAIGHYEVDHDRKSPILTVTGIDNSREKPRIKVRGDLPEVV